MFAISKLQIYQLTSADQFARILSDETLSVPREDRALDAALEWIEYDRDTREWDTATVLRQVQWKLIRNVAKLREALLNPIVNQVFIIVVTTAAALANVVAVTAAALDVVVVAPAAALVVVVAAATASILSILWGLFRK